MPEHPSVEQPSASTEARLERLQDAVGQLGELVRDAARKSVALETRVEAFPAARDIAVAVEAELERTLRDARDAIDARVGQLSGDLDTLERRLVEVGEALVPLEGLRTEIATVADESAGFTEIRSAIADAVARLDALAASVPASTAPASPAGEGAPFDPGPLLSSLKETLETTAATIRSDFEVLVRAEQEASDRRIDALGLRITNLSMTLTKSLEDLVAHSARIDERAHVMEGENAAILEAVRAEVASAVTAAGEEVRRQTENLGDALSARAATTEAGLAERVSVFESGVAERIGALQGSLTEQLQTLSGHIGALPQDMTTTLGEINRTLGAVSDLSAVQAAVEAVAEQLRAEQSRALEQLSERIADIAPSVAGALADVREALASGAGRTSGAIAEIRSDIGAATQRTADAIVRVRAEIGTATQQTATMFKQSRASIAQLAETVGGVERSRAELAAAIAALDEHLVHRTAGVKTSITDRAARLESQIASLPRADDVAAAVAGRLESIVSEGARKAEERADAVQHELSGIASNINEIWIRVRETAKGLEEVRGASREDSATMVALIEEMAQSEERSAARLAEAERRFVSAVRGIEHERDRIFIETLNEFLERLPRRERNRLGKRMRALNFGRRPWEELVEEAPQPLQPDAPVSSAEKEPEVEHPVPVLPEAKPKRTPPSKKKRAPTESRAKPKEIVREEPPEKPAKKEKVAPIRPATPLAARQPAAKARRRRTKKNTSPATETVEQPSETRPDSSTPINASQPSIEPDRPS